MYTCIIIWFVCLYSSIPSFMDVVRLFHILALGSFSSYYSKLKRQNHKCFVGLEVKHCRQGFGWIGKGMTSLKDEIFKDGKLAQYCQILQSFKSLRITCLCGVYLFFVMLTRMIENTCKLYIWYRVNIQSMNMECFFHFLVSSPISFKTGL